MIPYISTKDATENVSFKQALLQGLAANKALFVPQHIPQLDHQFIQNLPQFSTADIAFHILNEYVDSCIEAAELRNICAESFNFDIPLVALGRQQYILELFHGPTQAFKDFGARFMSRSMSILHQQKNIVLVATSGDTGGAVANGFYQVEGIDVVILFPKNRVSPYQQHQMCSLGKNIHPIQVEGSFDDCQRIVKQAFNDKALNDKMQLSSANSINIGRLLPQMLYYFCMYKALAKYNKEIVVAVPSGNFGNLTAGIMAQKMGLPIHQFIAATNANDTFVEYCKTATYTPKASVATYSNAMDVGAPSNFERLLHFFDHQHEQICDAIKAESVSDAATLEQIISCYKEHNYVLDPHAAVAQIGLQRQLKSDQIGVFLGTAHPLKFEKTVQQCIPDFDGVEVDLSDCPAMDMNNDYDALKKFLLEKFHH